MSDLSNADKFEDRTRKLFRNLNGNKTKGGRTCIIGGHQIDGVTVIDNTIVVAECTTKLKDHRDKIKGFIGAQQDIKKGLEKDQDFKAIYNKHRAVKFIYAVGNNSLTEKDYSNFDSKDNNLKLLVLEDIKYYENLAKTIPSRASYDFLYDVGCEADNGENIKIPCFRYREGNITTYNFMINPLDLIKITYVPRRRGKNAGYQRIVKPDRIKSISNYLKTSKDIIPTNIVIALNSEIKFKVQSEIDRTITQGELTLPKKYNSCLIIDGQHRLFSFEKGNKKYLSVTAFDNIDEHKQMKYFVDININAKPIDKNLLWDLQGDLNPNGEEGIISNTVKQLNNSEVFKNRFSIGNTRSELTMTSICNSIKKTSLAREKIPVPSEKYKLENPFYNGDPTIFSKNLADSLNKFINILVLGTKQKNEITKFIYSNGGLSILIYIFRLMILQDGTKNIKKLLNDYAPALARYLSSLNPTQVNNYKAMTSSEDGKSKIVNEILIALSEENDEFAKYIENIKDSLDDKIKIFEKTLTDKLIEIYKNKSVSTLEKIFKGEETEIRKKMKNKDKNAKNFIYSLTLGQKLKLFKNCMRTMDNIKNDLIRDKHDEYDSKDNRYANENDCMVDLDRIGNARKRNTHPPQETGYILTDADKKQALIAIDRFSSLI